MIEKLPDDIHATFIINDKHCHIKQYGRDNEWLYMCYPKEFIDKINELIDAINGIKECER